MRSVVIVAAGSSERFGKNKLNEQILDQSVLQRALSAFLGLADEIIVVGSEVLGATRCVEGGESRNQSVRNGLAAVSKDCTVVAIHDGARPFVSRNLAERLFCEAEKHGSAVPTLPVTDTLWQKGEHSTKVHREDYFTVQTPQVFQFSKLKRAFELCKGDYTDESTLFFEAFGKVHFVDGQFSNKKITVAGDLPVYRVGVGFDVHAFGDGNSVTLGGVKIPYVKKLVGHSDADVLAHAVCDAVLSASGNRDIGCQFPDTDDRYLGADSLQMLAQCVQLAEENGFGVENVSAVVICQQPKLAGYLDEMAQNIARVLKIAPSCVNLSATTTEHLGALGNGDGIAAQAQALLSQKV